MALSLSLSLSMVKTLKAITVEVVKMMFANILSHKTISLDCRDLSWFSIITIIFCYFSLSITIIPLKMMENHKKWWKMTKNHGKWQWHQVVINLDNNDDDAFQTLYNFSIRIANVHSWSIITTPSLAPFYNCCLVQFDSYLLD